jgi:thiol-disulfide isomerase/thioredoxin
MQKFHCTVLIFTLFLFGMIDSSAQTKRETGLHIGNMLPDLTLNDPDGNPVSISDYRGDIVFVDFWASWCRPCRRENPAIVETYKTYNQKAFKNAEGFTIISVSLDKNKEDWIKAIADDGLIWEEHVSDLKGWRSPAAKKFNVRAIPMNYLINQDGVIIARNLRGFQLEETLKNLAE